MEERLVVSENISYPSGSQKSKKLGGWHQRTVESHTLQTQPSLQRDANKGSYFLH